MDWKEQILFLRSFKARLIGSKPDKKMWEVADSMEKLSAHIKELGADNESLREGRCRWNCATAKEAFNAAREYHNPGDRIPRWRWKNYKEWRE